MTFSVVDQFFRKKRKGLIFSRQKSVWVGAESGLAFGLALVSKAVFLASFEISLLVTLEPHVGHTKFPDF